MSSSLDSSKTSSGDKDSHQRDGVIAAFEMDPRSFLPVWDETIAGEIRITVHLNIEGRRELVGFIVHKAKTGTVEIANFNANLSMDDLNIGGSTKKNNDKLAGAHGEGLKIAALVMIRDGFPVRIQSTSATWNFGFYKNQFLCQISQRNDSKIVAEKLSFGEQTSGGKLRSDLVSYSYKDVTVQLSHPETGKGYRVSITAEEFRSWTTVSLDLSRPDPEKIIRTPHGDLIIDEKFGGQTFMKSLRVNSQGLGGKSYKFGYNFVTGELSRDRERMISYDEETKTLAKIWEGAVLHGPENLVQRYIDLFEGDHADTISAEKASGYLARRIWTRLRTSQPNVFYYSEVSDPELSTRQVMIILNDFKKSPQKLAKELWQLLSKYDCARTPYEERVHITFSSQLVEQVESNFSRNVVRMVRSAMAMDTRLAEMTLQVVESSQISPNE
ncbi:hypothetical protein K4K58_013022 [Colletotrichum sp. SAR11_239]|nr:hypothetical protein K4K58_013022 [Colletotrichum sp. SAR11_239]